MARKAGVSSRDTEERIYLEGRRLFSRYGFAAVSMRQIAAAVGVNQGALYHYWTNKQDLLTGLLSRHMDELMGAWHKQTPPIDAAAALDHFTRFHINFHLSRPDEVFLSYRELRALTDENFRHIRALRQNYENILLGILNTGCRNGAFLAIDPSIATKAILAMLTGITTWYRPHGALSSSDIEDQYSNLVLRSVGAKSQLLRGK